MKKPHAAKTLHRRDLIPLVVVAVVAVGLVAVAAYTRLSFVSPLNVASSPIIYLPVIARNYPPDRRFGIAEHTPEQAVQLGLGNAHFIAGHWRLPLPGDTAIFLHPTERTHWSNFQLCSWSVADGDWYDKAGCRQWIREHPGMIYVVGNELSSPAWLGGDGDWIDTTQYARWYHEARALIKAEDPAAFVAPYGSVGQVTAGLLIAVWDSHLAQFGTILEADFYPVHHYCVLGDSPSWCWTKLTHWIGWLESRRGTHWIGPRDYWLTEWGLPAWSHPIPIEASLELMKGLTPKLQDNDLGVSQHAWWPSCNTDWPNQCTSLIRDGAVTALGSTYLRLALE